MSKTFLEVAEIFEKIEGIGSRNEMTLVLSEFFKELSEKVDLIGLDEIKSKAREYEIEENEIQSIVEKLREKGEIYSPKNGFYKITDRK